MASQANNRDNAQRKILEDLQLKKQLFLKQGVSQALSTPATSQQPTNINVWESFTMIRLKELESWLQDLQGFETPKVALEQYQTPPHIAAHLAHTIQASFGDLEGKLVADLGCGCGMLTAAAAILGAATVVGFDIDSDALETCKENLEELEITTAELVQADVRQLVLSHPRFTKLFDTVVLNPPFGTKCNQGIDLEFVRVALELSHGSVYSLHKTSTRPHILKTAGRWGLEVQVLARLRYDLPTTYKFHKKKSVDIEVDVIKFTHK